MANRMRIVDVPSAATSKDLARVEEKNLRRAAVARRRMYYEGSQYDAENIEAMAAAQLDPLTDRLPEHLRLHAYSTHIAEAVDFITDQLSEGFQLEATDTAVQTILDGVIAATDLLSGTGDAEDLAVDDVLRDALVAGDVAVEVRWDPIAGTCFLEFWDAEQVDFEYVSRTRVRSVTREEMIWVEEIDGDRQVLERVVYDLAFGPSAQMECRRRVFWDQEEKPRSVESLNVPILPWALLRADGKGLRATRGESLITDQAMASADRYNAVEQVAWLIARYNSHGNLVVVGDSAALKLEQSSNQVAKDVADVLTFPGGTQATALELPTDPEMIDHQKDVLADHLYAVFGLTRVDQTTIEGLGGISGYALEILNRKTEGTFRRIRRNWIRDWKSLVSLILDVTSHRRVTAVTATDQETFTTRDIDDDQPVLSGTEIASFAWFSADPAADFPNRTLEIRLGSGYIVDDVLIREDYTAKLISRKEALRQRGRSDEEIEQIEAEIKDSEPEPPEIAVAAIGRGIRPGTQAGSTLNSASEEE